MKRHFALLLAALVAVALQAAPRYIFYFIGDGMGMGHAIATKNYLRAVTGNPDARPLMMTFPAIGIASTVSASSPVTDSAASGTALATGTKTKNYMIGMAPDSTAVTSIAKILHDDGYGVGLITTVAPDDATPAAFYAHVPNRKMFDEIARDAMASDYEFIGGAGLRGSAGLEAEFEKAGVRVVYGEDACRNADSRRILLLNTDTIHKNEIGYAIDSIKGVLTLPVMMDLCLDHMQKYTPEKFFMMVEGGSIDHAAHSNDPATVVKEMIMFNNTLAKAYDFYLQHPDETLIVVTADHDTGGMATTGKWETLPAIDFQRISKDRFNEWFRDYMKSNPNATWEQFLPILEHYFSLGSGIKLSDKKMEAIKTLFENEVAGNNGAEQRTLYASYAKFTEELFNAVSSTLGFRWITNNHTGNPVGIYAVGVGADKFGRVLENSDIPRLIME